MTKCFLYKRQGTSGFTRMIMLLGVVFTAYGCESGTVSTPPTPIPPKLFDWSSQPTLTSKSITDIHFINGTFGWAVGQQLVLSTSDGGNTWPEAPLNSSGIPNQINSVQFISEQKGWMAGGVTDSETGEVFITEQGGAYPSLQETSTNLLNSIFFIDSQLGWAAGAAGEVIHTENGGTNWSTLSNLGSEIFDIQFTTAEKGWAVGENGSLYQTIDGENFNLQDIGVDTKLTAVHFTDTLRGWICGSRNTIYKRHLSSDNKIIWSETSFSDGTDFDWNDIYFIDASNGWVVGMEGNIYKTTDGGVTWSRETSGTFEHLNAIFMISNTSGWIAGDNGLILTYTP